MFGFPGYAGGLPVGMAMKPLNLGGPSRGCLFLVVFAIAGLVVAAQMFLFAELDTPDPCTMPNNDCSSSSPAPWRWG